MELKCHVQHYEWGKLGSESMVANLVKSADPTVEIDESKPYAELWVGTHPNGPSTIIERGILLSEYIKDNEDAIGPEVKKKFGVKVPFLLKVLSIRKALSIQAHPDKALAEQLHKQFPDVYRDDNHKPELAVALTPFQALCGFRPVAQIQEFFNKIPELHELVSATSLQTLQSYNGSDSAEEVIKAVFSDLMLSPKERVANALAKFLQRAKTEDKEYRRSVEFSVVRALSEQWPGDVGCWAPLLLHHLQLPPGAALYLAPRLPHAYLAGDCIEVMSCSDNVVRAGLTRKPLDVGTLLAMLEYAPRARDSLLLAPRRLDPHCLQWVPPVPDFTLTKIVVQAGAGYNTAAARSPALALVWRGAGLAADGEPLALRRGAALFVKASRQLALAAHAPLELYLATANVARTHTLDDTDVRGDEAFDTL